MVSPRSDVNTGQPTGRTRPHTNHRLAVPASGNLQQSNTLDSVALADDGPDQTFPACLLFTSGCHQRPTDWWHPIKNQNQDQNSDTRLMTSWSATTSRMVLVIRGVRVGQGSGWWCCLMSACGRSLNHHLVRDTHHSFSKFWKIVVLCQTFDLQVSLWYSSTIQE